MNNQTAKFKATEYLYDLANTAAENGFKTDEHWEVNLVSEFEKLAIERKYYPTVASRFIPDIVMDAFKMVKAQLKQTIIPHIGDLDRYAEPQPVLQYLIAYNPDRLRR
jgi:hypothetical protein